jgi:5-(carboxyamino)imidazole ribonucleotide synthase
MKIGVLGAGQLGRMLAIAGFPLGLKFRFMDTSVDVPAAHVAEVIIGAFTDESALARLRADCDVVTYEFENIPVAAAKRLAEVVAVYPPPRALEVSQDRFAEKQLFKRLGIPAPVSIPIGAYAEFCEGLSRVGYPAVLKTRHMGYDGKGQAIVESPDAAYSAWQKLAGQPLILEEFIPFDQEVSILTVRSRSNQVAFYPLVRNRHLDGILRYSQPLSEATASSDTHILQNEAQDYASRLLVELDYVGVLAVEFFVMRGHLLANEMAPRVHNSGHWTIEGAQTSQFENHLRAITGLPLGSTSLVGFSAMINLIGKLPEPAEILAIPGAHLHLYGKTSRPGRKLGHVTVRAASAADLATSLARLQSLITDK